jgi:ferredoxin-NADP reductase
MGYLPMQLELAPTLQWQAVNFDFRETEVMAPVANDGDMVLVIERIAFETPEIMVLELVRDDGAVLAAWSPGAHIELVLGSGKVRQYSLCGDPADPTRYRVAVLREAAGRGGSEEIHLAAKVGMTIRARGPRNRFQLVDVARYLFLAGGIGISPILAMVRQAELSGRPWRLVYGGRSRTTMAFLGELAERRGGEITLLPQDEVGLPDIDGLLSGLEPDAVIYGCGPTGMLKALETAAVAHGRVQDLHTERFSADEDEPKAVDDKRDQPFEVELRRSALVLQVPADRTLGSVLQEADAPVSFSCQEGYCGTCETRVLEGLPDHRDSILTDEEKAAGTVMMVCCGRSLTPRLVLDL